MSEGNSVLDYVKYVISTCPAFDYPHYGFDLHRSDHAVEMFTLALPSVLFGSLGLVAHDGGGKPRIIGRSCSRR
jgi:hypothetical protein